MAKPEAGSLATGPAGSDLGWAASTWVILGFALLATAGLITLRVTRLRHPPAREAPATAANLDPGAIHGPWPIDRAEPRGVDLRPGPEELHEQLGPDVPDLDEVAIWLSQSSSSVLHVAVRPDQPIGSGQVIGRVGGTLLVFEPIPADVGPVYHAAVRHPALRRATVSASLVVRHLDDTSVPLGGQNEAGSVLPLSWRGPEAPPAPPLSASLSGSLRTEQVFSKTLGEFRAVTSYLPPGAGVPAVIYLGDGPAVPHLARVIEPMILAGAIRPVALVGAHPAATLSHPAGAPQRGRSALLHPFATDPRAAEYVEPQPALARDDPDGQATHEYMFDRHLRFFADELPAWAESTLGVSSEPADRVLTGFSNSAALALTLAQRRRPGYAGIIAVSPAGTRPPGASAAPGLQQERFFLACGSWEGLLHLSTGEWARYLHQQGAQVRRLTPVAGHDPTVWDVAHAEALPWMLPPR